MKNQNKRILIKISGASIKSDNGSIFDLDMINNLATQIQKLKKKYQIGIVIGGGNIWRGNMTVNNVFKKENADYMGMLSTVINGIAIKDILSSHGVDVVLHSSLGINNFTKPIDIEMVNKELDEGKVIIFVGGTGHPYFTTDTGCVIRAMDIHANLILMGKDSIDGVYSDDPFVNKNAKFFPNLKFIDVINKKLKIMDLSALTLCEQNGINVYVFNILSKNCIINILKKKGKFTYIHK